MDESATFFTDYKGVKKNKTWNIEINYISLIYHFLHSLVTKLQSMANYF